MPNKHSVVFPSVVQPGHVLTAFLEHCEVYYLYNYYILEVSRCSVSKVQSLVVQDLVKSSSQ